MEIVEHLVEFDVWCEKCEYADKREDEEPCDSCLECPVNTHSHRPVKFKAKE